MSTIINATTTNGVVIQPDNSGSLVLQTNNGTTALTIDTSQRAAFVAGTAALPAITTTGDTNTGIFFPAADTIAFAEGGAEAMRLDSSGNVGIGTTSPIRKFSVASGSGPAYASLSQLSDNPYLEFERWSGTASDYAGARIKGLNDVSGGGGEITFETSNLNTIAAQTFTERMRITSTGLLQFNSGYGSVATAYGCRAWISFNGSGTIAIRGSGNVSSIVDNGTGQYTINLSTAMPDTNFCTVASGGNTPDGSDTIANAVFINSSSIKMRAHNSGAGQIDPTTMSCAVFR